MLWPARFTISLPEHLLKPALDQSPPCCCLPVLFQICMALLTQTFSEMMAVEAFQWLMAGSMEFA